MKKKKNKSGRDGGKRVYALLNTAPDVQPLLEDILRENNGGEINTVSNVEELLRLSRKGTLAWAILDKFPAAGFTELLVSAATSPPAAGEETSPRILLLSSAAWPLPALSSTPVQVLPHPPDKPALEELLLRSESDESDQALTPSAFFALLAGTKEEAWIRVNAERRIGDLCIRAGKAIYAEAGTETGDSAALRILGWSGCSYEYRDLPSFLRSNMDWPLTDLIARVRPDSHARPESPAAPPSQTSPQPEAPEASATPAPGPPITNFDLDPLPEPEPPVFRTSLTEIRNPEAVTEEPTELLALLEVTSGFSAEATPPAAACSPDPLPDFEAPATPAPLPVASAAPADVLEEVVSSDPVPITEPVLPTPPSETVTPDEAIGASPDESPIPAEAPPAPVAAETTPQPPAPEPEPAPLLAASVPSETIVDQPQPEPAAAALQPVEAETDAPGPTLTPAQAEPEPEAEELELVGVGVARQETSSAAEAHARAGSLDLGAIEAANGLTGLARISEPHPPTGTHSTSIDLPRKSVFETRVPAPPFPPAATLPPEPPAPQQAAEPEPPPAAPALTAGQQHAVQHALAELARDCRAMMGAALISSISGDVAGSFYREGKTLDAQMILAVWRAFRPIGERQQLGLERHVALTGAEATILIAAVRETDYLLVIHLAGAYPFWPIEHPAGDCERELRGQLSPPPASDALDPDAP